MLPHGELCAAKGSRLEWACGYIASRALNGTPNADAVDRNSGGLPASIDGAWRPDPAANMRRLFFHCYPLGLWLDNRAAVDGTASRADPIAHSLRRRRDEWLGDRMNIVIVIVFDFRFVGRSSRRRNRKGCQAQPETQ